jgi:hypothetical protein
VNKLSARDLETLYALLRRCRTRCDGRPFIEHTTEGEHDCVQAKCSLHVCNPMAASTVRQNPLHHQQCAERRRPLGVDRLKPRQGRETPRQKAPEPDPPSATHAARLIDRAFKMSEDWGTLVWLVF